jgi:hypothetical protein
MKIGLRRASSGDAENICAASLWFSGACRPLQVVPDPASARPRPLQPCAVNSRPDGQIPVVSFPSLHARHLTVSVQDQWRSRLLMCPFISYLELPFARLSVVTWSQRGPVLPSRGKKCLGKHICRLFLPALGICGPSFFWNWSWSSLLRSKQNTALSLRALPTLGGPSPQRDPS